MVGQIVRKVVRGGAAAALVLLASAVTAPSRAEASCGDYVTVAGQQGQPAHTGMMNHDTTGTHDPAKPRCHGPSCSNGSFPPAAPAPRIVVVVEHWALPNGLTLCQSPVTSSLLAETREAPCDGFGSSILRPPR
jgi:hypothetical protein